MFKNKTPKQSNTDFLKGCNIPEGTLEAMFAVKVRKNLAIYVGEGSKITKPEHIFAHFKIEDDLYINHVDSLDLIDVILDFEKEGMLITEQDAKKIFELNENNATVTEIINELINISKSKHNKIVSGNTASRRT